MDGGRGGGRISGRILECLVIGRREKSREWIGSGISNPSENPNFILPQDGEIAGGNPY